MSIVQGSYQPSRRVRYRPMEISPGHFVVVDRSTNIPVSESMPERECWGWIANRLDAERERD